MGRAGRRPPGLRPGRAPLRGAPRCCAAGACGRLPAPCTGCKRGTDPPLAPAPTQLPAGGRARGKPGLLRLGKYVQEAGAATGRPGRAPRRGAPRCCAAGACGRLPAPCTGYKRGADPPLAPAPTQLPAGGGALSPGSAGELANAAVLLQIVRRHSIFGQFSCRTA